MFFIYLAIFIINAFYCILKLYQPGFLEYAYTPAYSGVVIALINCFFLALLYYVQQIHKKPSVKLSHTELSLLSEDNDAIYSDHSLIDHIPNIFCIKNNNGEWLQAHPEYLKILRIQTLEYKGKTNSQLAPYSDPTLSSVFKEFVQVEHTVWQSKKPRPIQIPINIEKGGPVVIDQVITPIFDCNNKPYRLIITGQLILPQEKEKNKYELLNSIFSTSHLSFLILNNDLKITSVNSAFSKLLGYTSATIKNQSISVLINPPEQKKFCSMLENYFTGNNFQLWSENIKCQNKNGSLIMTKLEIKPIRSPKNTYENYFVTLKDVTSIVQNEIRLSQLAQYDHVTGLVNRMMFIDRLSKYIDTAKDHKLHAIIFFIDLDKFKIINDTLGHDAGDFILKETAKRLLPVTTKDNIVARFSGDEFAILLLDEESHEKAILSASLTADKIIKSLGQSFIINNREVFIGASIGISFFPDDGITAEKLLKSADFAMYEAKNIGRNNYQFYKKEFSLATQGRLDLEQNLRNAITSNELQLYYQPQYHSKNRIISGAEALIRWIKADSPSREGYDGKATIISPDQFIPIAEETGLIIPIGAWVLKTACLQFKEWLIQGYAIPQVSVNVSARQFMDNSFMQSVEDALKNAALDPKHLELEITESMLIGDLDKIELQLNRLKKMGIKIALDDFGTGYSSLSYLKKFPIDILKIDRSFIREMTAGSKDASIATAIIEMGHSLNQKIVAEGVENETQLMLLTQQKCDYIQGYYFSKPLPAYKMSELLKEHDSIDNS